MPGGPPERTPGLTPGAARAQNKPLLAPGRQAALNEGHRVVVGLSRGQGYLPDLSVTGARRRRLRGRGPAQTSLHSSSGCTALPGSAGRVWQGQGAPQAVHDPGRTPARFSQCCQTTSACGALP